MKTFIKTIHEETYSDGSRTLGVLQNYSSTGDWKESIIYIYREEVYIFFNTIIEMIDYLLYSDKKTYRAYLKEDIFDKFYDDGINGKFSDILEWIKNE